ncbi:MAG: class I SAM-dependent methyltransferase [Candidatus Komeilibacteria bacterium]|nr:class I SAM-dependent methyltransferase [Candidatus Komeilibacteria bacterium]
MLIGLIIILLVVLVTAIIVGWSFFVLWRTGVPFVTMRRYENEFVLNSLDIKPGQTFLDLGCGDGRLLKMLADKYQINGTGYELNIWAYWRAKLKTWHYPNIRIYYGDYLKADWSSFDYIFTYAMPGMMTRIQGRLVKERIKNCTFATYAFRLPSIEPTHLHYRDIDKRRGGLYIYLL